MLYLHVRNSEIVYFENIVSHKHVFVFKEPRKLYHGALNKRRFSFSLFLSLPFSLPLLPALLLSLSRARALFILLDFSRMSYSRKRRNGRVSADTRRVIGGIPENSREISSSFLLKRIGLRVTWPSEIARAQENCESFAFRLHRESRDITEIHLLVEGKSSLPINSV